MRGVVRSRACARERLVRGVLRDAPEGDPTMTMSTKLRVLVLAGLGATACIETPEEGDGYGSIGAAVTATGSDGATYRLMPGAYLQVVGQGNGFGDNFGLDGDAATISIDVPVGDYAVYLYDSMSMGP